MTTTSGGRVRGWNVLEDYRPRSSSRGATPGRAGAPDRAGLKVSAGSGQPDEVLETWTSTPGQRRVHRPGGPRDRPAGERAVFATAVATCRTGWRNALTLVWAGCTARQFPSLTQADALGYGPAAEGPVDRGRRRRRLVARQGPAGG